MSPLHSRNGAWLAWRIETTRGAGGRGGGGGPAALEVPQADGLVAAAGQGRLAVRRERHGPDVVGVPGEAVELGAAGDVPQPHGAVVPAREGPFAVGREGHANGRPGVALEPT